MLYACVQRFDVTGNLKKFCKILGTKHALLWQAMLVQLSIVQKIFAVGIFELQLLQLCQYKGFFKNSKLIWILIAIMAQLPFLFNRSTLMVSLPPQGDILNFSPSPSTKLCYRCLSSKYLVRECRGEIRCIYCFNYGHRARFCYQRKARLQLKWAAKPCTPPLSPCALMRETFLFP